MISFSDLQDIISTEFFDGNLEIAGVIMFIGAMIVIFAFVQKPFYALILGMGVTMMFSLLGILSAEITILMIIVSVLGLAYTSRALWRD